MNRRHHTAQDIPAIVRLFTSTFADSEGEAEAALIGRLARKLFATTAAGDLFNFVAESDSRILASIFFTRLEFGSGIETFILGPVGVDSAFQGKGVGQGLIKHGLADLRARGVAVALTYGDPDFYGKLGFRPVSHETIQAPYELSQPVGWLGQSLAGDAIDRLSGRGRCVAAFRDPAYW